MQHKRTVLLAACLGIAVIGASVLFWRGDTAKVGGRLTRGNPAALTGDVSAPSLCGNGTIDFGEQCDDGSFNGQTNCSITCKRLFCGDGIWSSNIGEQCEPPFTLTTVTDPTTGKQVQERKFTDQSCGLICTVPVCNPDGTCVGGCKRRVLPDCPEGTSSSAASSAQSVSSLSSVASSASSTVMPEKGSLQQASSASSLLPVCGNGVVEAVEECDDGAKNSDQAADACRKDCTRPRCGDGVKDKAEECDDGNSVNDDACTNDCRMPRCGDGVMQKGEQCDDGSRNSDTRPDACRGNCMLSVCGDGVKDKGEACDDGNRVNGDGCSNDCRLPTCGDGIVQQGEECDDGMRNSDTRPGACRTTCLHSRCGDGVADPGEACDDGVRNSNTLPDACRLACTLPVCGDGVKDKNEECDDGALNSDTRPGACRTTCLHSRCGDGIVDPGEQCDDGNIIAGDGCAQLCRIEDGWTCTGVPSVCAQKPVTVSSSSVSSAASSSSSPAEPVCGNGVLEAGEQCDDGARNSDVRADACRTDCRKALCGDGVKDAGEECDPAAAKLPEGVSACSSTCKAVHAAAVAASSWNMPNKGALIGILSTLEAIIIGAFLLRKQLARSLAGWVKKEVPPTLEDIALDQIELRGGKY